MDKTQYKPGVNLNADQGSGRALIILRQAGAFPDLIRELKKMTVVSGRAIDFELEPVSAHNWRELTAGLREALGELQIRQAAFVGFGPAGAVLQHLCYLDLKIVRSAVLVDSSTRPNPSLFARLVDWLERKLPLGLPLRLRSREFDGASFLQRIRCPALVVVSPAASGFERESGRRLADGLPTAWLYEAPPGASAEDISKEIISFQDTPARCPQKRAASKAA